MNNKQQVLIEAEKFVICHLISDKRNYFSHKAQLHRDLFFEPMLREVFCVFEILVNSDGNPNIVTISKKLSFDGAFNFLSSLLSNINYHSDFESNLKVLTDYYKQYRLGHVLMNSKSKLESFESPDEVLSYLQKALLSLEGSSGDQAKPMSHHLRLMMNAIEKNMNSDGALTG